MGVSGDSPGPNPIGVKIGVKIVFAGPTNIAPQRLSGAAQVSAMPGVGAGLRLLDGAAFKR
jgi:hypothetical protein